MSRARRNSPAPHPPPGLWPDRRPGARGASPIRRLAGRLVRAGESGQSIIWVAVMFPFFVSIVGLAIDGGIVFSARRELQNVADGAARAGAMQISEWSYRRAATGAGVDLDPIAARRAALEYLQVNAPSNLRDARVQADVQQIEVELEAIVETAFLRLVNIREVGIKATAPAEVRYGVERGNR
ncbi:MAG: Tad domain-containing protein [Chloroflexota bacterium]|nr:Tad domain-containing protein [Chloroflexota bacterium]